MTKTEALNLIEQDINFITTEELIELHKKYNEAGDILLTEYREEEKKLIETVGLLEAEKVDFPDWYKKYLSNDRAITNEMYNRDIFYIGERLIQLPNVDVNTLTDKELNDLYHQMRYIRTRDRFDEDAPNYDSLFREVRALAHEKGIIVPIPRDNRDRDYLKQIASDDITVREMLYAIEQRLKQRKENIRFNLFINKYPGDKDYGWREFTTGLINSYKKKLDAKHLRLAISSIGYTYENTVSAIMSMKSERHWIDDKELIEKDPEGVHDFTDDMNVEQWGDYSDRFWELYDSGIYDEREVYIKDDEICEERSTYPEWWDDSIDEREAMVMLAVSTDFDLGQELADLRWLYNEIKHLYKIAKNFTPAKKTRKRKGKKITRDDAQLDAYVEDIT